MDPAKASLLGQSELLALLESASRLTAKVELADVLNYIILTAGELSMSPAGSIFLHDPERDDLYFAAVTGPAKDELINRHIPIEGSKAGLVFRSGTPLVENSLADDRQHYKAVDERTESTTRSMICVPLAYGDQKYGAMQLINKAEGSEAFTDKDLELLMRFAVQASLAIRNASLFDQILAGSGLYSLPEIRADLIKRAGVSGIPASKERCTILFADMRGFAHLCQIMGSPESIQSVLSSFLAMLSTEVIGHRGIVNKYLGDGLLAIFRGEASAVNAVHSAFAMVEAFGQLLPEWDANSNVALDFLDIGIGIATDSVILGTIGDRTVRDFTVVGTAVNLAAALEKAARNGRHILCDQLTYRNIRNVVAEVEGPLSYTENTAQGAGIHEYKMYHLQQLTRPKETPIVFVSHDSRNRRWVEEYVVTPLRDHHVRVFFADDTIRPAQDYHEAIRQHLDICDWVAVVISEQSVTSKWVQAEVAHAFDRPELLDHILVILTDEASPDQLYMPLRTTQYLDFRGNPSKAVSQMMQLIAEHSEP